MAGLLVPATMLTVWFQKRSSVIYRQIRTNAARLIAHFVETVTGIRAVKSYRRQRANGARYEQLAEDHRQASLRDRKSTRLNSSHVAISYAVFCLKKKKKEHEL